MDPTPSFVNSYGSCIGHHIDSVVILGVLDYLKPDLVAWLGDLHRLMVARRRGTVGRQSITSSMVCIP